MGFQGLIADFGGVLTTPMLENSRAFEQAAGLRPGAYWSALNEHPDAIAVYAALEVGRATQADWNEVVGGILGIDPTDLMRRALSGLSVEATMAACVAAARSAGVVTALLSNSFGGPYNVYADLGLLDLFDVVVLSGDVGVRKPDSRIYEVVLQRMGVAGQSAVFVDDIEDNLPPAAALGITTLLHTDAAASVRTIEGLFGLRASPQER